MEKDLEKIETALLCGYSYVEVGEVRVPLSIWELKPITTPKQKEAEAKEKAKEIYNLINKPL